MSRIIEAKWVIFLLSVMMAAIVVLSGPVAGVLDLSEPTAEAKKKKKKKQQLNKIECVRQGALCNGTPRADLLIGTGAKERLQGGEGNDVYDGKNGQDTWFDSSTASNDTYRAGKAFEASAIIGKFEPFDVVDNGGSDTIDFGAFNYDDIVEVTDEAFGNNLGIRILLNEDPRRTGVVILPGHLDNEENKIENFKFADRTVSAEFLESDFEIPTRRQV
jgi:hypothetical protein